MSEPLSKLEAADFINRSFRPLPRSYGDALVEAGAELVFLAGWLKLVGPATLAAFDGRVLNTHPALLPRHGGRGMHGRAVHQAVLDAGDAVVRGEEQLALVGREEVRNAAAQSGDDVLDEHGAVGRPVALPELEAVQPVVRPEEERGHHLYRRNAPG